MTYKIRWDGTVTALSSIAHGGEQLGTTSLLRREKTMQADGSLIDVPIIAGNTLRGWLRRAGEDLLRSELHYDRELSLAAAHALRGGGALAKVSGSALTGQRLADLRDLVPHVGVFGCAAGGRIIDGALQVGKVVPLIRETRHRVPENLQEHCQHSAFDIVQIEMYARQDDRDTHAFTAADEREQAEDTGSRQMAYGVETFPAGLRFHTWLQLNWVTELELSFFVDVLAEFTERGRIGGRLASGHGVVRADLTQSFLVGIPELLDWREHLRDNRTAALEALQWLT